MKSKLLTRFCFNETHFELVANPISSNGFPTKNILEKSFLIKTNFSKQEKRCAKQIQNLKISNCKIIKKITERCLK